MDERWIEVEAAGKRRRVDLGAGLTRLGGKTADVVLFDRTSGELHLWDDPPKLINIAGDATLTVNGAGFEEHSLEDGDRVEWGEIAFTYRVVAAAPVLEEIPIAGSEPAAKKKGARPTRESRVAQRVQAGLLAELGLADKKALSRWQQAVMHQEFDADACARDILAASDVGADDPRVLERSGRLTRDLIMAPLQRGVKSAGRRARGAAKSGAAFLMAQAIIGAVCLVLLLLFMVFVHVKWPEFSFDKFLGYFVPWEE